MFDRVLDITHELAKQGLDKRLVEKLVVLYRDEGVDKATAYLVHHERLSGQDSVRLVKDIDRRYVRTNRQILVFYLCIFFLLAWLAYYGWYSTFYFLLVVSGFFLLRRGWILYRFIRKNRFQFHRFSDQPEQISVK